MYGNRRTDGGGVFETPPPYLFCLHARIRRTFRHTLFIPRPSEFYVVLLLHPLSLSPIFFPDRSLLPFIRYEKIFSPQSFAALFPPSAPNEKILTKSTKESIIKHILCGYVGTGRQDGLRIRWETVQVRALLSAPREKTVILTQPHRYHGLFFLRIDLFSLRP